MRKIFKIILKIVGALLVLFAIIGVVLYIIYNQPLPEGKSGQEAEALAEKMVNAINFEAYQNTQFLDWSFNNGAHTYTWDKTNGKVIVKWSDYLVNLNLNDNSKSIVLKNNNQLSNEEGKAIIKTARDYFNNDSFWLVAPFKVLDQGTKRSIVELDDGTKGLMVTYSTGGSTPGDSYLWKLQDNGFPISYQMWVSIIPIGGIEASWDDWQIMESGVFLPTTHKLGPITLDMGTVKAYN